MKRSHLLLGIGILSALLMLSCGGGGGSSSNTTPAPTTQPPPPPTLSITNTQLPNGVVGKAYSAQLQANNGTAPYTWTATTPVPTWLLLDAKTGALTGTPAGYTSVYVTFKVTDSATPPATSQKELYIGVNAPLTLTGTAPAGVLLLPYSWQSRISGGSYPFTATIDSGLPPGMTFVLDSPFVTFGGTPTTAGDFTVNVRLRDSATPPQEVVIPLKIPVTKTLAVLTSAVRNGVIGRTYGDTVKAVNGTQPLHWVVTNLPPGLAIDPATGALSGVPTEPRNGAFGVTVTDSSIPAQSATSAIPITVYPALTFFEPVAMELHLHMDISQYLYAYGGVPPVSSSIISGALPPGLSIVDVYRSLQGTPTQVGAYNATVRLTDGDTPPGIIDQAFTFNVLPPLPIISNETLPGGSLGKPYAAKLWARDGTLPYHWTVSDGHFPPGLTLDDAGNVAGTPTTLPPYAQDYFLFTASVTDSASPAQTATRSFAIAVSASSLGRNDSIATATPLGEGSIYASFSPYADPADSTTSAPDSDYYKLVANVGTKVTIFVTNGVDPVIEILDPNGQRFKTCRDIGDDKPTLTFIVKDVTPDAFDDECLNDDIDPTVNRSADLEFMPPGTNGTQTTFYLHVFDASGNARPDMQYQLYVTGTVSASTVPASPTRESAPPTKRNYREEEEPLPIPGSLRLNPDRCRRDSRFLNGLPTGPYRGLRRPRASIPSHYSSVMRAILRRS